MAIQIPIQELIKTIQGKFSEQLGRTFQSVFLREEIDKYFLKFIYRVIEIDLFERSSPYWFGGKDFSSNVANKIIDDLLTQQEKNKLIELIAELKKKNSSLIKEAELEIEAELTNGLGTYTWKVFDYLKISFPESITLLALVKADSKHFRESRKFLSEMWEELRRTSDEEKPNCNKQEVKNCVSDALAELEILVNGKENSDNDKLNNQKKKKRRLNNRLTDLIKDGEEVNDLTELKEIIAKIEKFRGEEKYDSLKDKINKLKKKLANQNSSEYCKINREMIENELKEDLIKEEELDNEIKKELEKLRIGIINQIEIDEIKNKISDNIKLKKAEKELDSLLNSYRVSLSSREKKNLLKKLNSFTKKKNYFSQQACQKKKNEIEEKKNQLKSNSFSQQSSLANDNFPLAAKSMIGVYLLTAAIIVLKKIPKIR